VLGIAMVLITAVFLPPFLLLIFGKQYQESVQALQFLAPAGFAVAIGCASGAWLNLNNFGDILLGRTLLGATINIVLNLILIPRHGMVGAAIATSVSQLVAANLLESLDSRTRVNHRFLLFPF
jgi:PST family polysaccharide transporter